ncbi:hypothetical protein AB5I41_30875 [Sphingomonas sp. MMS24-JH45]
MVDAANYIGIGGWATKTLTLRKVVAGSNTALTFAIPADYKNFAGGTDQPPDPQRQRR